MLHNLADAVIDRFDPSHEEESLRLAKDLLVAQRFEAPEIAIVVDAIRFHGCHDGRMPDSIEGKVMAASDAIVRLTMGFYHYGVGLMRAEGKSADEIRAWALPKIRCDYDVKIFDDVLRAEVAQYDLRLQAFFRALK